MIKNSRPLSSLRPGENAVIDKIITKGDMRRRLFDLGLVSGTKIECVLKSPGGDPKAYFFRGTLIALRQDDCEKIFIKPKKQE